jgi:hypothetical protein
MDDFNMNKILNNVTFEFICKIQPRLNIDKTITEFYPQENYKDRHKLKLHKYGLGSFCKFTIPNNLNRQGVYALFVNEQCTYVGECNDFSNRWNTGYGTISPRNCFEGGQSTNCRINKLVLDSLKNLLDVEIYFTESLDRFQVEYSLIANIKPSWNKTIGKPSLISKKQNIVQKKIINMPKNYVKIISRQNIQTKYSNLTEFLKKSDKIITLSYKQFQDILKFKLPNSAYDHKAWWSNGGHNHAYSWMDAGFKVTKIILGKIITFERMND